jgi:hypothetical protein
MWHVARQWLSTSVVALLLASLNASPVAAEEWLAGAAPGDSEGTRVAWIRNADGNVLLLRGQDDGSQCWLFAEFRPGNGEALGGDIPSEEFRAGYPIKNDWQLGYAKYGKVWGHIGTDRASWMLVAATKEEFAKTDVLKSWLSGADITIIYVTDAGAEKTTRFRLAGPKSVLAEATGWNLDN